jgi:hypothetical protein
MIDATTRRGRGRPKGRTRYAEQDASTLLQAADLMIRDDTLSVTAALKRATGRPSDDTLIHRLRGKMKPNIEQLLAEARGRVARSRPINVAMRSHPLAWKEIAAAAARTHTYMASPTIQKEMQLLAETAKRANAPLSSPEMQAMARMAAEATRAVVAFSQSAQGREMQRIAVEATQWANSPYVRQAMQAVAGNLAYYRDALKVID